MTKFCTYPELTTTRIKSFFASFFSKKEDSSFSEEKEAKRLLILRAAPRYAPNTRQTGLALQENDCPAWPVYVLVPFRKPPQGAETPRARRQTP
jgi:hypothetical protein